MSETTTLWGFPPAEVSCVVCGFKASIPGMGRHCRETGHGTLPAALPELPETAPSLPHPLTPTGDTPISGDPA